MRHLLTLYYLCCFCVFISAMVAQIVSMHGGHHSWLPNFCACMGAGLMFLSIRGHATSTIAIVLLAGLLGLLGIFGGGLFRIDMGDGTILTTNSFAQLPVALAIPIALNLIFFAIVCLWTFLAHPKMPDRSA